MVNGQDNNTSEALDTQIIEKIKKLKADQKQYILRQLEKFEFMERREYQRFRCDNLYVGYDVDGTQSQKLVLDISEGGVFMKTDDPLPAGQKVILTFADSDGRAQYRINSTVVRTVNSGIALVFDADNQQQRMKIKSIMNYVRHVGYIIDD
jgi:hypothetical protein